MKPIDKFLKYLETSDETLLEKSAENIEKDAMAKVDYINTWRWFRDELPLYPNVKRCLEYCKNANSPRFASIKRYLEMLKVRAADRSEENNSLLLTTRKLAGVVDKCERIWSGRMINEHNPSNQFYQVKMTLEEFIEYMSKEKKK